MRMISTATGQPHINVKFSYIMIPGKQDQQSRRKACLSDKIDLEIYTN